MEGEIINFILVCMTTFISLLYCHTIGKYIPHGATRLLAIAPTTCLFLLLPLNLSTVHLCGLICFFIAFLANFKLLLFAFGKEPLCNSFDDLPIPLPRFLLFACFPIKISHNPPPSMNLQQLEELSKSHEETLKGGVHHRSLSSCAIKFIWLCASSAAYNSFKNDLNSILRTTLYVLRMYYTLDIALSLLAILTHTLIGVELEPQFDNPHLATSLQNFWGRRWNLMVSSVLRSTVYQPVRAISTRLMVPRKWISQPAIFATFLVSGIMHEIIFYYMGRLRPTYETTFFFVLQGVCVNIEIIMKKTLNGKFKLPTIMSRVLTFGILIGTVSWLFIPPLHRFRPDVRAYKEMVAFREFVLRGRLISPNDISSPLE